MTTPGAKLLHDGQFDGPRVKLSRAPRPASARAGEHRDARVLHDLVRPVSELQLLEGEWQLCDCQEWPDNRSNANLLAWCWKKDELRSITAANYPDSSSQGMLRLPWGI